MRSACCLIVETSGSTPRKTGARMTVFEDGRIRGTIGGGHFEKVVIADALDQIQKNEPRLFEHHLLQEHEMCCGGTVKVFIEPQMKKKKLFIFGAGHVGAVVARLASYMDFEISVIDDREECLANLEAEHIIKIHSDFKEALPQLVFDEDSFIVIMTYDHEVDRAILAHSIQQPHAYLGCIGSRRKIIVAKKMLLSNHVATASEIDRVDMPIGFDIGAEGPEEIAISIMAKLIAVKNRKAVEK